MSPLPYIIITNSPPVNDISPPLPLHLHSSLLNCFYEGGGSLLFCSELDTLTWGWKELNSLKSTYERPHRLKLFEWKYIPMTKEMTCGKKKRMSQCRENRKLVHSATSKPSYLMAFATPTVLPTLEMDSLPWRAAASQRKQSSAIHSTV